MVIEQKIRFGENNFVERHEYSGVEYNTEIKRPIAGKVVIKTSENRTYELRQSHGNILNPKTYGFFEKKNKIDNIDYQIFFVDESEIKGMGGTKIKVPSQYLEEIHFEEISVQVDYKVKVINSVDFIKNMITDSYPQYNRDYFLNKVRDDIVIQTKDVVSKNINQHGLKYFDSNLSSICEELNHTLNNQKLGNKGLEISIIALNIIQDDVNKAFEQEYGFHKQLEK